MARIGDMLVEAGFVTDEQVQAALSSQKETRRRLGEELVALGYVSEIQLTQVLSNQLSIPWVSLYHVEFSSDLLRLLPAEVADSYCCIPVYKRTVRKRGETLFVAMDDPTNEQALEMIHRYCQLPVKPMVAPPSEIRQAIRVYYFGLPPEDSAVQQAAPPSSEERVTEGTGDDDFPEMEVEDAPDLEELLKKKKGAPKMVTLTLLDGTTVKLPGPGSEPAGEQVSDVVTASELVAQLLSSKKSGDPNWETLFATLLSLLLKKGLIADWEFIEAYKSNQDDT